MVTDAAVFTLVTAIIFLAPISAFDQVEFISISTILTGDSQEHFPSHQVLTEVRRFLDLFRMHVNIRSSP